MPAAKFSSRDEVAGRREHQAVAAASRSRCHASKTSSTQVDIADVDSVVVEVVAERGLVALAQRQRRLGLGGIGEPHQLVQPNRAVGGGDIPQHATGADGGELPVVADQPHRRAPRQRRSITVAG